jgi:glycosyltransferase involved in cell wall biosynthesis
VTEPPAEGRPGVVVVSYNTRRLTAQLIYSLYRTLRPPEFHLVVVDNGSTDGSAELLSAVADAGLCDLIRNLENRYHGPALNQGMSRLAELHDSGAVRLTAVWLVDSDCVVLRPDALSAPRAVMRETGAEALQRSCAEAGLVAVDFPYTRDGYVIHVGRGSLRQLLAAGERTNRHYDWATTHHEPHFALEPSAPAAYAAFQAAFARDVSTLDGASLVRACR